MFLALPSGTLLEADDQAIRLYHGEEIMIPKPGSYVQMRLAKSPG
jgi:hypothetical protein